MTSSTSILETVLRLYWLSTMQDSRELLPHLVGPPGTGKSSIVQSLGEVVGVKVHTLNVSRISPLELEGVQMPVGSTNEMRLQMLIATYWSNLEDGDILFLDEFLRGFPEVYNGLLDIITSREVAGFKLPKVFIIAASNSTLTYDEALADRLYNIQLSPPVTPTDALAVVNQIYSEANMLTDWGAYASRVVPEKEWPQYTNLLAGTLTSQELAVVNTYIYPMYSALFNTSSSSAAAVTRPEALMSQRHIAGRIKLRLIHNDRQLYQAVRENNNRVILLAQFEPKVLQHYIVYDEHTADVFNNFKEKWTALLENPSPDVDVTNILIGKQMQEQYQLEATSGGSTPASGSAAETFLSL